MKVSNLSTLFPGGERGGAGIRFMLCYNASCKNVSKIISFHIVGGLVRYTITCLISLYFRIVDEAKDEAVTVLTLSGRYCKSTLMTLKCTVSLVSNYHYPCHGLMVVASLHRKINCHLFLRQTRYRHRFQFYLSLFPSFFFNYQTI